MNSKIYTRITILGTGSWGISIARLLAKKGYHITAWSAIHDEIRNLSATYIHPNLPEMDIPRSIVFTSDISVACKEMDLIVVAVPSIYVRDTISKAKAYISDQVIISATKGLDSKTHFTMTEVIKDELGKSDVKIVALSGPTHAEELAKDMPTTIVSACEKMEIAEEIQEIFMGTCMRVYTNIDVIGVQLCGALKNIVALAVGISRGLGYGDNVTAALITRGASEIAALGEKYHCLKETIFGLSGIGDIVVTATSHYSRNFRAGYLIGIGCTVSEAIERVGMVVEGINALFAAVELSNKYGVDMPIVTAVNSIVNGADPRIVAKRLMERDQKSELSQSSLVIRFENSILNNGRRLGMKRVITYGTFDLLHYGHINLLKRAKALGDYLIVVVSSDEFNWNEKQKKCYFTYEQRKALVEAVRYVDLVIPENSWAQKRSDMHEYHVDTFVMGDDWKGKFDFLKEEGVEVVYLSRTPEISSSKMKADLYDSRNSGESVTDHSSLDTDPK